MFNKTINPKYTQSYSPIPLRIKGIVCHRCVAVVRHELEAAGFQVLEISLGQVHIQGPLTTFDATRINDILSNQGFALLEETVPIQQRVKDFLTTYFIPQDLSEISDDKMGVRLSLQLQEALKLDYNTISSQFGKAEGITLEK